MTVGDYTQLADTEIHFDKPRPEQNRWHSLLKTSSEIPLWAVRNAKPAKGFYPVLIYAPSDSSVSWENADLCEYLASYGYVVLASPSMGVSTRDMSEDLDGINAQARDISFLISYAKSLPNTDSSEVAVISWSWGGISSLFASTRDPRIDALVEMDGSMRYYPGLVKKAEDVHPERMTIPLLCFTRNVSLEDLENDDVPPRGRSFRKPCGSPPSRVLRGRKTAPPSVCGRLWFPLAVAFPLLRAEMVSSPGFLGNPFGSMPRARDSGDPGATSQYRSSGCCLPPC